LLETPKAPEGYQYRWLRIEMMGEADKGNISKRIREGYELVRPEEVAGFDLPMNDEGAYAGTVGIGGLVLGKIPLETVGERNAYYGQQTREQLGAIDAELARHSNSVMPIGAPQRETQSSFGNPENKPSATEE